MSLFNESSGNYSDVNIGDQLAIYNVQDQILISGNQDVILNINTDTARKITFPDSATDETVVYESTIGGSSLNGEVTGSLNSNIVSSINGKSRTVITDSIQKVEDASSTSNNTLVLRDSNGDFSANDVTFNNISANNITENNVANTIVKRNINNEFIASRIFSDLTGDVTATNVNSTNITCDNLNISNFKLNDNEFLNIGTGNDLQIYHNGTNSFISNSTGLLQLNNDLDDILAGVAPGKNFRVVDISTSTAFFSVNNTNVVIESGISLIGNIGNKTHTQIETSVDDTLAATNIANPSTICKRDSLGGIILTNLLTNSIADISGQLNINNSMYFRINDIIEWGSGNQFSIYRGTNEANVVCYDSNLNVSNRSASHNLYFKIGNNNNTTNFIWRDVNNIELMKLTDQGHLNVSGTVTSSTFFGNLVGFSDNTNNVGSKSSTQVVNAVDDVENATSSNIALRIVKRDASGQINISDMYSNDLYPNVTETYDLGASSRIWRNAYIKNNLTEVTLATSSIVTNNSNGGVTAPGVKLDSTGSIEIYDTIAPQIIFHANETGNSGKIWVDNITQSFFFFAGTDNINWSFKIGQNDITSAQDILIDDDVIIRCNTVTNTTQLGTSTYKFKELHTTNIADNSSKVTLSSNVGISSTNILDFNSNNLKISHNTEGLIENADGHLKIYNNSTNTAHDIIFRLTGTVGGSRFVVNDSTDTTHFSVIGSGFTLVKTILPFVDNTYDLGSGTFRFDDVFATNGTIQTSDKNMKEEIEETKLGLDFISKLKPVSYKWKGKNRKHTGLIAQDLKETLGDEDYAMYVDSKFKNPDEESRLGIRYQELISPMIKSIQEMSNIINKQKEEIEMLKKFKIDISKRIRIMQG